LDFSSVTFCRQSEGEQMADKAHEQTDQKLQEMEKRLSDIYSRATQEFEQSWRTFWAEAKKEVADLQKEYDTAKASGDKEAMRKAGKELQRAKKKRTLLNKHYRVVTQNLAAELANVNATALAYINGELPELYALNYNALAESVDGVGGYSFALVDADTVRNLATTDDGLLPYKYLNNKKDIRWNVQNLNSEVLQGILQGEPMDKIANRLQNVVGMNESAAIRNARTMVTGAENKGRQDSYNRASADGIILDKEWIATEDSRTREAHRELDGKIVHHDEPFSNAIGLIMFPGDPGAHPSNVYQCRCSMRAKVIGFRRLPR
jgi:SPP1 gp7 family putative phage head morphogenesis protein